MTAPPYFQDPLFFVAVSKLVAVLSFCGSACCHLCCRRRTVRATGPRAQRATDVEGDRCHAPHADGRPDLGRA